MAIVCILGFAHISHRYLHQFQPLAHFKWQFFSNQGHTYRGPNCHPQLVPDLWPRTLAWSQGVGLYRPDIDLGQAREVFLNTPSLRGQLPKTQLGITGGHPLILILYLYPGSEERSPSLAFEGFSPAS